MLDLNRIDTVVESNTLFSFQVENKNFLYFDIVLKLDKVA
ncbi:hypothetical protein QE439_004140 [Pedobacter agri]|nr:hypothetical protein [Pedobacter agri]